MEINTFWLEQTLDGAERITGGPKPNSRIAEARAELQALIAQAMKAEAAYAEGERAGFKKGYLGGAERQQQLIIETRFPPSCVRTLNEKDAISACDRAPSVEAAPATPILDWDAHLPMIAMHGHFVWVYCSCGYNRDGKILDAKQWPQHIRSGGPGAPSEAGNK